MTTDTIISAAVRPLLSADDISERVQTLGQDIADCYTSAPLTVLGVMTGGLIFAADLVRAVNTPLQLGVLHARSYRGTQSGSLTVWTETLPDLYGRNVLIVDDIFDTGQTLSRVVGEVMQRSPASVQTAVLLRKDVTRTVEYEPDYVAFEIADEFVVGYGLDYNGEYRHLPGIGVLEPAAVSGT